jgi:hypothetical protein
VQLAGKLEVTQIMAKTIPPLNTTTHHDGSLPSPLSYTLANDNPPHPSMTTQHSQKNERKGANFGMMDGQDARQCSSQTNSKQIEK